MGRYHMGIREPTILIRPQPTPCSVRLKDGRLDRMPWYNVAPRLARLSKQKIVTPTELNRTYSFSPYDIQMISAPLKHTDKGLGYSGSEAVEGFFRARRAEALSIILPYIVWATSQDAAESI